MYYLIQGSKKSCPFINLNILCFYRPERKPLRLVINTLELEVVPCPKTWW
jgi:hypothetical protein